MASALTLLPVVALATHRAMHLCFPLMGLLQVTCALGLKILCSSHKPGGGPHVGVNLECRRALQRPPQTTLAQPRITRASR